MQNICRGEDFRPIYIDVFDWNRTQADKLIGTCSTCFADLKRAAGDGKPVVLALYEAEDVRLKKKSKAKGKHDLSTLFTGGGDCFDSL